ncbi:MAG: hypothetical protein AABZ32_10860 [Bacteroidota bacterium]
MIYLYFMKTKFLLFIFTCCLLPVANCFSQGTWTKKEDFPGSSRYYAVSFSIGNKGYYGMGQKQVELFTYKVYTDFWEYDAEKNTWTQKAEFPKDGRLGVKGFSVSGKGYVGFGYFIMPNGPNAGGNDYQSDMYEFDPVANLWTKKNGTYLDGRDICFVLNDTAWSVNPEYRIVKKYNPLTDTWAENEWGKKALAPAYSDIIGSDVDFSAGGKQYIITSIRKKGAYINHLWEFNPRTLVWTKKNNLPIVGNDTVCAFSAGEKGYVICGKNNLLEYNPTSDVWTEKKESLVPKKYFSSAFIIQGKYYFVYQHEVWEFAP